MKGIRKRVGALLALLTIKLDTLSIDLVQGCVPMFWAFLHKVTCGLVSKIALDVPNFSQKELH